MIRKQKNKQMMNCRICNNCAHCQYIGEGDSICDITYECVLEDWEPTDNFMKCDGKHWEV